MIEQRSRFLIIMTMVILNLLWASSFLVISMPALAKEAVGWHWYNEIYPEDKKDEKDNKNKKENTAMIQMAILRQTVREAKAKAILYPTESNMRTYLILQNFVMGKANMFTHAWKKTLLDYPELDYSILHPTQNSAQHVLYAEAYKKENKAIKSFSEKYGLFFFYRGNNSLDQALASTIGDFCKENNISLMPISMDGKNIEVFATSQINRGHAERLGIKHFPALVLVDPKNQKVQPLNYGFISGSELRRRFLQVATNFQEGV